MTEVDPPNSLAAKFSLPHAVAAQIVLGEGGIDAFEPPALLDTDIRALASRVEVVEDADMSRRTPDERPAAVRVVLRDGRVLEAARSLPRGDESPISDAALREKFLACATRVIEADAARELLDGLWTIDAIEDVDDLW
jgi:2-methylcitrate dehydratase PrpD